MTGAAGTYKPSKEEIYVAIDAALADVKDPSSVQGTMDIYRAVAKENPNWTTIKPRKFKKYQFRVVQAKKEGVAPADLVKDDESVVSTASSIASSIKSKFSALKSGLKKDKTSSPDKGGVPASIGGALFSPSPIKDAASPGGVQYSAIPAIAEGDAGTAKTSTSEDPVALEGALDAEAGVEDRGIPDAEAYADDNDGGKSKECCAQGCVIC